PFRLCYVGRFSAQQSAPSETDTLLLVGLHEAPALPLRASYRVQWKACYQIKAKASLEHVPRVPYQDVEGGS
ncbi:hypothetical protein KUCAC02_018212, partial [Chaenocephalus aceratus]